MDIENKDYVNAAAVNRAAHEFEQAAKRYVQQLAELGSTEQEANRSMRATALTTYAEIKNQLEAA